MDKVQQHFAANDVLTPNEIRKRFGLPIVEEKPPSVIAMTHDELKRVQSFLSHFGRRGMKWGQHIFTRSSGGEGKSGGSESGNSGTSGTSDSAGTAHKPSDAEQATAVAAKIKKEGLNSVSNAEMQVLVSRLNLQRQLSQITAQPSRIERGRAFFNRQLKAGKTVNEMIAFANSPAGKLIFSAMSPTSGRHAVGSRASNRVLTPKRIKV